jgi:galactitol-specific phosphotransferase system IIC component
MYWDSILLILAVIIAIIVMIRQGYIKQVKQGLLYLVTKAEQEFGSGTGELKYAAVADWIYEKLPAIARLFLSAETIDSLIELAVDEMKDYLSINNSAAKLIESKTE